MEQNAPTVDPAAAVERLQVLAYEVPVDGPEGRESDGMLEWDSTTCIVVLACAGGQTGVGYTYGDVAVARMIDSKLAGLALGTDALTPTATWHSMFAQLRNAGRPGAGAMAVSAVDIALWDLHARLLGCPLFQTLPAFHDQVPVYGSGGFTNYPLDRLARQLAEWVEQGIPRVKMKTSRHPDDDPARLAAARKAIGDEPELFTDANRAYSRKEALAWARRFRDEFGVTWLEEPVSSEDVEGLALLRGAGLPGLDIAAGEYGFLLSDFGRLLDAGRSTACRQTSPAVAGSPACCRPRAWRPSARWTCPRTARPRSPRTRSVLWSGCGTWSPSMTTSGSRPCSSTARRLRWPARCGLTRPPRASGSSCVPPDSRFTTVTICGGSA